MSSWERYDLERIGAADELQLAARKADGTLRKPVIIWVVRVGDDLYVRAGNGRESWFRYTQQQHAGRISAGGVTKDVVFVDASGDTQLNDSIDAVYQTKYHRYGATYVDPMVTALARSATLKLEVAPAS